MEAIKAEFENYIINHSQKEPPVLHELNRETHLKVLQPRMLSGHYQGRILSMLSHMIRPKRILEIGTYTGYSAICLAEGLAPDGKVDTIEINEELQDLARQYIAKAGMTENIILHTGNATELMPQLNTRYDLIFIDADKENYLTYLDLAVDMLLPGGYLLADNVLWNGKVLNSDATENDRDTKIIDEFNKRIQDNPGLQNVLLPVRDGLMLARKII